jgi:hypothetical protein
MKASKQGQIYKVRQLQKLRVMKWTLCIYCQLILLIFVILNLFSPKLAVILSILSLTSLNFADHQYYSHFNFSLA